MSRGRFDIVVAPAPKGRMRARLITRKKESIPLI